jgi:hypothetical protein
VRFEHSDQVRLVVAFSLTALALPVLLREGSKHPSGHPTVAAVTPRGEELASPLRSDQKSSASTTVAPTTSDPVDAPFLGSTPSATASHVITIAIPTTLPATSEVGPASYRRWDPGSSWVPNPCTAPGLDVGTRVAITNTDNGHQTSCIVVGHDGVPAGQILVLDTPLFEQLATLVDSPIPVQITWK